jgi:hypothetical protein
LVVVVVGMVVVVLGGAVVVVVDVVAVVVAGPVEIEDAEPEGEQPATSRRIAASPHRIQATLTRITGNRPGHRIRAR